MSDPIRSTLRDECGFDDDYIDAMVTLERARCQWCGKSVLAHSAAFVKRACPREVST